MERQLLNKLFDRTVTHPMLGPYIELVPTDFLLAIANPQPTQTTDLGEWADGVLVSFDRLWDDLLFYGMRDPFIIGVGRVSRTVRLEAGNHRIRLFHKEKIILSPAVVYVGDQAITCPGNGTHQFGGYSIKLPVSTDILGPYPIKEYMKPSDVFYNFEPIK